MQQRVAMVAGAALAVVCGAVAIGAQAPTAPAGGPASAQANSPVPPLIREGVTEKISAHVHVIPDNGVSLVPNVGIVVGSKATLVVDTGLGARNGATVMREVAKVGTNADVYLVTTHVHPEHDLGAMAFPPDTKMLRSRAQEEEIAATGMETATRFAGLSALNAELLKDAAFRKADITFDREHTLDFGDVKVRLLAVGPSHTRGDTVFYVEPDGVLFSGDLAMTALPSFASPASSLRQWLESLDRVEALRPKRIVPSHGPMGDAGLIANYRTFLTTVRRRTGELKAQGRSLDDTVAQLQKELSDRYDRQRMVSAIRVAYSEGP